MPYTVVPRSHDLQDATILAEVHDGPAGAATCEVLVVIARAPDLPSIDSSEVQVRLIDGAGGVAMPILAPSGALPEAGGSLGMSANARFQFRHPAGHFTELIVLFRGNEVRFQLTRP